MCCMMIYDDMTTWRLIIFWMTVEIFYFGVDVMMFYSAAMFLGIINACLVIY